MPSEDSFLNIFLKGIMKLPLYMLSHMTFMLHYVWSIRTRESTQKSMS